MAQHASLTGSAGQICGVGLHCESVVDNYSVFLLGDL